MVGTTTVDHTSGKMDYGIIFALFLVHFIGDFFMSFISPLLPVLTERYSLTMTQVGTITGVSMVMAFLVQPSVGYLADRFRTRVFILGGPLLSAIFIPLYGWAWGFTSLLLFTVLGSIGQSMFHPPAAGMVPAHAGRHQGFSMAIFILGGTVAFGVGPVFVAWYVTKLGFTNLPYCGVAGAIAVGVLFILVPKPEGEGLRDLGFWGAVRDALGPVWKPLFVIWLIIVFRVYVLQAVMTYFPIMLAHEGLTLVSVGGVISTFVIAGSISGLLAGHLADKIGYKPVFLVSYLLTPPSLYLFLNLGGKFVFLGAFLGGFFTLASLPLATAMAQDLVVRGKSLVASLTMGLAFGTGGLLNPLTGKMADLFGIRPVLGWVIWFPLLATILILFLPSTTRPPAED